MVWDRDVRCYCEKSERGLTTLSYMTTSYLRGFSGDQTRKFVFFRALRRNNITGNRVYRCMLYVNVSDVEVARSGANLCLDNK